MAITTFPRTAVPRFSFTGVLSFASILLDASAEKFAVILRVPKTGTLHSFEFRTGAVGNNPDNGIRLSFQDVSLTTGDPDGTQDQYCDITASLSASTWQVPPNALTDDGTSGGNKRSVTAGDLVACVVEYVSFTASDSFNISMVSPIAVQQEHYGDHYTASWAKQTGAAPSLALKYDDGTYGEFDVVAWPISAVSSLSYGNGSTPDEYALRFQVPIACRAGGCWVVSDLDGAADVVLYDASNTVLASVSLDPDVRAAGSTQHFTETFSTSVELSANTTYRLALKPTSATTLTLPAFDVNTAALMACVSGGAEWYRSSRTDAGAWTDTTTSRPLMGLIFDGFESGGATGGFTPLAIGAHTGIHHS
jgi:hypothetical protein